MRTDSGRNQNRHHLPRAVHLSGRADGGDPEAESNSGPKGLRLLPLRYQDHTALLYLYRPAELRVDLKDQLAEALLADAGYSGKSSEQCVAYLAKRFRSGGEFPHEVGLFLSYPPQDVRGFIENHAVNYKCAGLWKVYGDEALARRLFEKFRKCTDIYCALWRAGSGIDQLAVAV